MPAKGSAHAVPRQRLLPVRSPPGSDGTPAVRRRRRSASPTGDFGQGVGSDAASLCLRDERHARRQLSRM